jgi:hypothetical protein
VWRSASAIRSVKEAARGAGVLAIEFPSLTINSGNLLKPLGSVMGVDLFDRLCGVGGAGHATTNNAPASSADLDALLELLSTPAGTAAACVR